MSERSSVSIVGASGYSGAELLSLLLNHSSVRVDKLFASGSAGKRINELYPRFTGRITTTLEPYAASAACSSDFVCIALPPGEAMKIVPELLERGKRVIDLGGDFRLQDPLQYERYYHRPHESVPVLQRAVYGLTEWNRDAIRSADLVANPGCYPTSVLLPLLPFLKANVVAGSGIIINSLSGVSGAGRKATVELSFAEVNESVKAYKVGVHQHLPEISSMLEYFGSQQVSVSFVPHLLPLTRGIYSTISAPLTRQVTMDDLTAILDASYREEPFVRFSPEAIPEIRNVAMTNTVEIGYRIDAANHRLLLLSAIDNLLKGAAGQAVQNLNLMAGYPETEGLRA